jgi:hypothetical protein
MIGARSHFTPKSPFTILASFTKVPQLPELLVRDLHHRMAYLLEKIKLGWSRYNHPPAKRELNGTFPSNWHDF